MEQLTPKAAQNSVTGSYAGQLHELQGEINLFGSWITTLYCG